MKYTSNDIQIILIHPVVSAGQGGAKVVDHPVYIYISVNVNCNLNQNVERRYRLPVVLNCDEDDFIAAVLVTVFLVL